MATSTKAKHGKGVLIEKVLDAVQASGWNAIAITSVQPFELKLFRENSPSFGATVYIWNCTHGGKSRASDEFRIQFTGEKPIPRPNQITVLLGWHAGYEVFVGWGIANHAKQEGSSPSAQVKQTTLEAAHTKSFSTQLKKNGEVVVAFRPEFMVEYLLGADTLHHRGVKAVDVSPLNDIESATSEDLDAITDAKRKLVVMQIVKKYRAHDFRNRVLGAYGHRCAACGVQLELIDAAHVLPVEADGSTDETCNGIALCKLHHAAFDRNLISFDERYRIELSKSKIANLRAAGRDGGISDFTANLKPMILLPTRKSDQPAVKFVVAGRSIRRWGS